MAMLAVDMRQNEKNCTEEIIFNRYVYYNTYLVFTYIIGFFKPYNYMKMVFGYHSTTKQVHTRSLIDIFKGENNKKKSMPVENIVWVLFFSNDDYYYYV